MNQKFKGCLERKQIYQTNDAAELAPGEMATAEKDFQEAEESFQRESFKWATIQSYYAAFHAARALLYSQGYRERSHYCVIIAMKALFVESGKLPEGLIKRFADLKALREKADYEMEFSTAGAENGIRTAKELLEKAKKLL